MTRLLAVALCALALMWVERHQPATKQPPVAPTSTAVTGKTTS